MAAIPLAPVCPVCRASSLARVAHAGPLTILRCRACSAESARQDAAPAASPAAVDHFKRVDQERYERSVRCTREASYDPLLTRLQPHVAGRRWLDVGCSFGWLLQRLSERGFDGYGVEPSPGAAASAQRRGLKVSLGAFPDVIGGGAPYHVVTFMDVLEHLPDPVQVLMDVKTCLVPGGIVVVQVPDQSCLLYWLARALARWSRGRVDFALQRLWLAGLDFPHLVYFTRASLGGLFERCGYEVIDLYRAPISQPGQARDRVTYLDGDAPSSAIVSAAVGAVTALDAASGHGGLLVAIARPRAAAP